MFKPLIVGLSGTELTDKEISFIHQHKPWGFILFARNIASVDQVYALTSHLRRLTNRVELPILIDQEGGRVARLRGQGWRQYPAAASFYAGYSQNPELALDAIRINAALQAAELRKIGVTVNCAPMIDVRTQQSHDIIGDRAFSHAPKEVAAYGKAVMEGLSSQGVLPIIKHIPGHGRALCDSHESLPKVDSALSELLQDFEPFIALNHAPLAMTAHILYQALDDAECATLSEHIIRQAIRGMIGFSGLLMTDDMSMKALSGTLDDLSLRALRAGCDLVLHCNGDIDEMTLIANALNIDNRFLALRTEKIFADLHLQKSPRSEQDLMEEYQEIMVRLNVNTLQQMQKNTRI
ncbi:MAG: beta-N-acetylhexosaminidase [Alphaproteobacteria bacterium]|jgi:beta-N-acetylhexosaminidase